MYTSNYKKTCEGPSINALLHLLVRETCGKTQQKSDATTGRADGLDQREALLAKMEATLKQENEIARLEKEGKAALASLLGAQRIIQQIGADKFDAKKVYFHSLPEVVCN